MQTKLLTLIFAMLLGHWAWGQGATTAAAAWADKQYWFEMEQDIDVSDPTIWSFKSANSRVIVLNEIPTTLSLSEIDAGITSEYVQKTYEYATNDICEATDFEEWFIIKLPSTGVINIDLIITDPTPVNQASNRKTLALFPVVACTPTDCSKLGGCGEPLEKRVGSYDSNISLLFDNTSGNYLEKYVALRIGNNYYPGFGFFPEVPNFTKYKLAVYTTNNICEQAIHAPVTVTPFTDNTDKGLLNNLSEPTKEYYLANRISNIVGDNDLNTTLPSGSNGLWFKVTDMQTPLFLAACGSSFDPQMLIFRNGCPEDDLEPFDSDDNDIQIIVGAEDQNVGTDNGSSERTVCSNTPNDPYIPVMLIDDPVTDFGASSLYIYLFGTGADEKGAFNLNTQHILGGLLPVDWLGFTAQPLGNSNRLDWSTATETQNDYFILEKSADGINYESLATIPGQGDAIFQNDYSTLDESPYYQTYYRISQVDYDGTVNTGPQTVVINDSKKVYINLLANPVTNNEIKLRYRSDREQEVVFFITSTDGKAVQSQAATLIEGAAELSIPIPDLSPGMYLLSATLNNERWVEKVVVR